MRGVMNNERKQCTITWFIENYSSCWHKIGDQIFSPEFTADGLEGTVWRLRLYPRGYSDKQKDYISLYLQRNTFDDGPVEFPVTFSLSILGEDGSTLISKEREEAFKKPMALGYHQFQEMDEILLIRKADYLPQDTLSVQCKLWRDEGKIEQIKQITARTRIGIKQISFPLFAESFSALEPNENKTVQLRSNAENGLNLSSSLYYSDDSGCEGIITVEIAPSKTNQILSRCKISLLDVTGKLIPCGEEDNRFDAVRRNIQNLPLTLTRQIILNRKSEFLPDDKLTLLCECTFSTGVEYESIETTLHDIPLVALNQISNNNPNKDKNDSVEQLSDCPSALDDFKEIYNNRLLTDVQLKTKTKSFPTHKLVLCARSSVFQAMLTSDMREKNTACVNVDDLENDTVQQLLLFLYSDNIENLQWESAIKLYYAGDKYAIGKLKVMCASFLVKNLSTTTASELLLLADTHNDSLLKKAVEDFIFKHEEQVFGSDEWRNLIETNPVLVSKTMCLKYKR